MVLARDSDMGAGLQQEIRDLSLLSAKQRIWMRIELYCTKEASSSARVTIWSKSQPIRVICTLLHSMLRLMRVS